MIAKVTRSIYTILENIAEREIEKDPIGFIREESFLRPALQQKAKEEIKGDENLMMEFGEDHDDEEEEDKYEELQIVDFDNKGED